MDSKKKTIVFSLVFGVASLALVCFVIYPLFKGIKKNSEELIIAKRESILLQGKTGKIEQFRKAYEDLKPDLEKIDNLFTNSEVPIDLIKFLKKTAEDSELSNDISSVSVKTEETGPWSSLDFRITLEGFLPDFLKFLEKIETAPYLIEVQNLSVKKVSGSGLNLGVNATLIIKVYTKIR